MNKLVKVVGGVFAALMFIANTANATTLSFTNVSNNSGNTNISTLLGQLSVEYTYDSDNAYFTFLNDVDSGMYASITNIFFGYDDTLTTVSFNSDSGSDVNFSDGSNPANIPSGTFSSTFSSDADNQPPTMLQNGVDTSGEFITFAATLGTFTGDSLYAAIIDGTFNLGIHVQGIDSNDFSDSFEVTAVPLPAAAWLFGSALIGLFAAGRRRNKA